MRWTHDVIVVGAGSAGLTAAGGLGRLGLKVALVEHGRMGGECLNTGCVPSKALLASARRAQQMRDADRLGISGVEPVVDFVRVKGHVQAAIAAIAPHDSAARFEAWGVEVIRAHARFTAARTLDAEGRSLSAKRFVLAVGSRPAVPSIPGLESTPYLTNETLFDLDALPRRLVILGGGPVGVEMAQAFRRLGAAVALVERGEVLSRDDPEARALVAARLREEGVDLRAAVHVKSVACEGDAVRLDIAGGPPVTGDRLLVAVGRRPAIEGLGLETAGVKASEDGVVVDARRRTSNPHVFAIGDCREGPRFTHAAGYEGRLIVQALGFGLPAKADYSALPRVTYTDPELVQVGFTEGEARARYGEIQIVRSAFADNDRAVTEGATEGFLKLVRVRGRLVGATLVGAGAGELAGAWVAAIGASAASPWALSGRILPYPTRGEISQAAAMEMFTPTLFGPWARRWAKLLAATRR